MTVIIVNPTGVCVKHEAVPRPVLQYAYVMAFVVCV